MAKELADTKPIRDDVAGDLKLMLNDSKVSDPEGDYYTDHNLLMQKLTSYIVRRDQKVWNHAYTLGLKRAAKEAMDGIGRLETKLGLNKGKENK